MKLRPPRDGAKRLSPGLIPSLIGASNKISLDELKENLKDIYEELTSGRIPCAHRVGDLVVA